MRAKSRALRDRRGQRGLTLLEAVVAMAVFSTGVAALFGMIGNVSQANRSLSFQNNSLDLFTRISAQIRDAQCDYDGNAPPTMTPGMMDPGLTRFATWITTPAGNSTITAIGDITSNPNVFSNYVPRMSADYMVTNTSAANEPPSMRIEVRVREIQNDPVKDSTALTNESWIRVYPVNKVCAPRYDGVPRGAFL